MRGHGESDKVDFGYKIQRLAKDVHGILTGLGLSEVALLGHSMGCSVIWCYWDLFGSDRVSKLILADQPPFVTSNPAWDSEEHEAAGALMDIDAVVKMCNALAGPDGHATAVDYINRLVPNSMSEEEKAWIIRRNLCLPRQCAATLLYNSSAQDWRDVIPRINIPTPVVGGKASFIPWNSQVCVHHQIPDSQIVLFEEDEGGYHFMFIEGAAKFNQALVDFLALSPKVSIE